MWVKADVWDKHGKLSPKGEHWGGHAEGVRELAAADFGRLEEGQRAESDTGQREVGASRASATGASLVAGGSSI